MSVVLSNQRLVNNLIAKNRELKSARTSFENLWQDVTDLVCPDRADFTLIRSAGSKRLRKLLDDIAVEAAPNLAANINGIMTDPSAKWFGLKFAGGLQVGTAWKRWLSSCLDIFWAELYSPWSNFAAALNEAYLDDVTLNTSLIFSGWNAEKNCLLFQSRTVAECVIDENQNGLVDQVFRTFRLSAGQLMEAYPDFKFDDNIKKESESGRSECKYEILHAVVPNHEKGKFQLPFKGYYILLAKKAVLKEEMYNEFPFAVSRWSKLSGEVYGRGPGIFVINGLQMLQDMMRSYIKSAQKAAEPPLLLQNEETFVPGSTGPNGIMRYETYEPRPFNSGANFQISESLVDKFENRVRRVFMVDRLADVLGDRATATEVLEIIKENARILGPVYWRQVTEKLNPLIVRSFNLCLRHGKFPPMPGDPAGIGVDIEYLSPLAQAMKYEKAGRIMQAFATSEPFLRMNPNASAIFDVAGVIRKIHGIYGVEDDVLLPQEEAQAVMQQMAEAQAQQVNVSDAATALELQSMQNQVKVQDEVIESVE